MAAALRTWFVNEVPGTTGSDQGVVALTAAQLDGAAGLPGPTLEFDQAMVGDAPETADNVEVTLPEYRGKRFALVLGRLIGHRLATPQSQVTWRMNKRQGPDSVRRLLCSAGWQLGQRKAGAERLLAGCPPVDHPLPVPESFSAEVGGVPLRLAADYGVFSPTGIDAGTQLLIDVALRLPVVETVADIGIGYGPLAIGLVKAGRAGRAVATDVDCIALWLARHNAGINGVDLRTVCAADPAGVEPTGLTVCNVPTHIDAAASAALMSGLMARAKTGRLLVVVHASLEQRYVRYFTAAGLEPSRHRGPAHVVLDSGS